MLGAESRACHPHLELSSLRNGNATRASDFALPRSAPSAESERVQEEVETFVNDWISLFSREAQRTQRIPAIAVPASKLHSSTPDNPNHGSNSESLPGRPWGQSTFTHAIFFKNPTVFLAPA